MSFLLYHWSPLSRRRAILHRGLMPGSWSTDRQWKPPYVCFADSPSLAWALSGATERGKETEEDWDLWMMHSDVPSGMEALCFDDDPEQVKEYRVYERVYERDLWWVGSRALSEGEGRA